MSGKHSSNNQRWTVRDRMIAIFQGKKPDHIPFIDRMDFWYQHHLHEGTMPDEFQGMSKAEIHRAVGIGQEEWQLPYRYRYHDLEVIAKLEGKTIYHETDPILDFFPAIWDLIPADRAGTTITEFITPVGKLVVRHEMLPGMIIEGSRPYYRQRPIQEDADYRVFEYIIERAELIPYYDDFLAEETRLGDHGYLVPNIERIPFQSLLLDIVGEVELFYALHDSPHTVERLLEVLNTQTIAKLNHLADLAVPYVEFVDNLDGFMTNPVLFEKYCLPAYQQYSEILHTQGKKIGSHTDGDLSPLVHRITECGLDVCESFTPAPITGCTFEQAWQAWRQGPIIWGGIPSYYLEERASEEEFRNYVEHLLDVIADRPIILGVGDAVMGDNSIERVRTIADRVEEFAWQ